MDVEGTDSSHEADGLGNRFDRRSALKLAGVAGIGGASLLSGVTAASAAEASRELKSAKKKPLLVFATHFFYGVEVALGMAVGFRDFTDAFGLNFKLLGPKTPGDLQQVLAVQAQALRLKPDMVITAMNDPKAYNRSIERLIKAVPYVGLTNTQPDEGNPWGLSFVGATNYPIGVDLANILCAQAVKNGHKNGKFLAGRCCPGAVAVDGRTRGVQAGVKQFNSKNGTSFSVETFFDHADTDPTVAVSTWTSKFRQGGKDVVGAVDLSHGTPYATAMKQLNIKPHAVAVGAFDSGVDTSTAIKQGYLNAVADQQLYSQGYIAAAMAWQYWARGFSPELNYDSNTYVTPANVEKALKRDQLTIDLAKKYGYKV